MARKTTQQVKFVHKPGDLSSTLGVQRGRRKSTPESSLTSTLHFGISIPIHFLTCTYEHTYIHMLATF